MPTGSGCCVPSTPVLALSFSTSTTPTTATTTTSKLPSPRSRLRCPACTRGSTSSSPGTDRADAPPGLPAAAGLDCAGRGGHRIHLLVLQRARPVAARKEHQNVAGERPDPTVADDRAGSVENAFATSGFIGPRWTMAKSDGHRALPAGQATGGPAAGGRRRPGDGSVAAVRRRRRPDRPGRPRLRAATTGFAGAAGHPTARWDGDRHGTPARLRGAGAG